MMPYIYQIKTWYDIGSTATLLLLCGLMTAQSLQYDVIWKGDSIGYVHAQKFDSADYSIYTIDSEVTFWFFGSKRLEYRYHTLYHYDELIRASTRYLKNGNLKSTSQVIRNDSGYEISQDGEKIPKSTLESINGSINTIYHQEPGHKEEIFSERFGQLLPIESPHANRYVLTKPDGRTTTYEYVNGICERVLVDHFFARFTFERRK